MKKKWIILLVVSFMIASGLIMITKPETEADKIIQSALAFYVERLVSHRDSIEVKTGRESKTSSLVAVKPFKKFIFYVYQDILWWRFGRIASTAIDSLNNRFDQDKVEIITLSYLALIKKADFPKSVGPGTFVDIIDVSNVRRLDEKTVEVMLSFETGWEFVDIESVDGAWKLKSIRFGGIK